MDGSHQALDEGLFHVLSGVTLSLSSINNLLHSPAGKTHEEDAQQKVVQLQVCLNVTKKFCLYLLFIMEETYYTVDPKTLCSSSCVWFLCINWVKFCNEKKI